MTFLCGRGGVYALGAVGANLIGDHERRDLYLNLFLEVNLYVQIISIASYSYFSMLKASVSLRYITVNFVIFS